jgi:hypothetical protein
VIKNSTSIKMSDGEIIEISKDKDTLVFTLKTTIKKPDTKKEENDMLKRVLNAIGEYNGNLFVYNIPMKVNIIFNNPSDNLSYTLVSEKEK